MLRCGLLGETLGHSYSPMIHHALGEYDYRLFEIPKEDLDAFLALRLLGRPERHDSLQEGGGVLLRGAVQGGGKTAKRQYPRPPS